MKFNGIAVGFGQLIREWSFEGLFLSALPAVEPSLQMPRDHKKALMAFLVV